MRNEKGFMLIELLIVIAIILILASIGIKKMMYGVEAERAVIQDALQGCVMNAMTEGKIGENECVVQFKDDQHYVSVKIQSTVERVYNQNQSMYVDTYRFYIKGQKKSKDGYVPIKSLRGNTFECKIWNVEKGLTNNAYVDCRVKKS